jgi:hypothetical protein
MLIANARLPLVKRSFDNEKHNFFEFKKCFTITNKSLFTTQLIAPLPLILRVYTVKVMIMSRYHFGPNVTDRYIPLLTVTEFYRYLRYKRYRT